MSGIPQRYRVAIIDDEELRREGIAAIIYREKEFEICGAAADRRSALSLVEIQKPEALVLSLFLRDGDGIDLIKNLAARFPKMRLVVMIDRNPAIYAERTLRAGATVWIPRRASAQELIGALRNALTTDPSCPRRFRHQIKSKTLSVLTDRELCVLRLIGRGLRTGDIAQELGLSRKTIEYYRERIKSKLGYADARALSQGAFEWARHDL